MEARALARLGEAKACDLALAAAVTQYERRKPEAGRDPAWFQYFDERELLAEFGHCLRDLNRAGDSAGHAGRSFVLLTGVPAEAVVIDRRQDQVPLPSRWPRDARRGGSRSAHSYLAPVTDSGGRSEM